MARNAAQIGCEAVQVFSRSPRGGKARELPETEVSEMKAVLAKNGIEPLVVHAPYFLNLASFDEAKRASSVDLLVEECMRAHLLGARFVVVHLGHRHQSEETPEPALLRSGRSIKQSLEECPDSVTVLLENTAGQGKEIGWAFEDLAALMKDLPEDKTGVCLDTCHAFGAGYDLSNPQGIEDSLEAFDRCIGLSRLRLLHLNDSKGALGCRVDRHAHIGHGNIGLEGFKALLNNPALPPGLAGILETPVDSPSSHRDNIGVIKSILNSGA